MIVLTKSSMFLIKYIAEVLGVLMNGIYQALTSMNIPNVGLAIIIFTVVMYILMTPLQIKQQKFSKLNALMQPDIKKIQDKYKGKGRDQLTMQKQNEEIQAVYQKYGVSPTGSCAQLAIQMPILFALYQVIYKIPGYITAIRDQINTVAGNTGFTEFLQKFAANEGSATLSRTLTDNPAKENVIDAVYALNTTQWSNLLASNGAEKFADGLKSTHEYLHKVTTFLGLSIADSPSAFFMNGWRDKQFLLMFAAILIPLLAYASQLLNIKLMPQPGDSNKKKRGQEETSGVDNTMKQMNIMMPIMSAVFCFTLPFGVGIYWIAGALVRSVQQFAINKHLDKQNMDEIIEKSRERAGKKREKQLAKSGFAQQQITMEAQKNVRRLEINEKMKESRDNVASGNAAFKEGSIASKANMVAKYNQTHKK